MRIGGDKPHRSKRHRAQKILPTYHLHIILPWSRPSARRFACSRFGRGRLAWLRSHLYDNYAPAKALLLAYFNYSGRGEPPPLWRIREKNLQTLSIFERELRGIPAYFPRKDDSAALMPMAILIG
jgi:hypothetical protein